MSKLFAFLALAGVSVFGLVMSGGSTATAAKAVAGCCSETVCERCHDCLPGNCVCEGCDGCACCDAKASASDAVAVKAACCMKLTKSACCEQSGEAALLAASNVVLATVADATRPANLSAGCCSESVCESCRDCSPGNCQCAACDGCLCCAAK